MLGLGETDDELKEAMADLRAIDVDILTLGQYLQVIFANYLSMVLLGGRIDLSEIPIFFHIVT